MLYRCLGDHSICGFEVGPPEKPSGEFRSRQTKVAAQFQLALGGDETM